mgnify:CR=1 FL=1
MNYLSDRQFNLSSLVPTTKRSSSSTFIGLGEGLINLAYFFGYFYANVIFACSFSKLKVQKIIKVHNKFKRVRHNLGDIFTPLLFYTKNFALLTQKTLLFYTKNFAFVTRKILLFYTKSFTFFTLKI